LFLNTLFLEGNVGNAVDVVPREHDGQLAGLGHLTKGMLK
jgi:hypothetical protein